MSGAFRVFLGVQITRRKFIHQVFDADDREVYASRSVGQVFDWLADNDIEGAEFIAPRSRWDVSLAERTA